MNRSVLTLTLLVCLATIVFAADEQGKKNVSNKGDAQKSSDSSSLDQQLLDSLDKSLLNEEPKPITVGSKKTAVEPKQSSPSSAPRVKTSTDIELERKLHRAVDQEGKNIGEDLGQPSEESNPIVSIAERMKVAEQLVDQNNSDAETQRVQKKIVDDLEKLLQGCKKCQSQCSCNKPGECNKPSNSGKGSQVAAKKPGNKPSEKKASNAETGDGESAEDLLKKSWGLLPQRVRDQITQGADDEFLPKYDAQIRLYFERMLKEAD